MGLIESLRAKYELYRLEQRYTKRDKRKTFASAATYVDGEYIYDKSPTTSTSSNNSWGSAVSGGTGSTWSAKRGSIRVKELMTKSTSV